MGLFQVSPVGTTVAYTNRTIRLAFDGTDDNLPALGDDIWVTIANPMLMPMSVLQPDFDIELDANGRPKDPGMAMKATLSIVAKLIMNWNVYDPRDNSENPEPLGLPVTLEKVELLPLAVTQAINEIAGKALERKQG